MIWPDDAVRYEEALQEIAAYNAGGDWFIQQIIDIAKDALGDAIKESSPTEKELGE